jgi:hypothetical protein
MRKVDEMRRRAIIGRILQAAKRGSLTEIFGYECRQVRSAVPRDGSLGKTTAQTHVRSFFRVVLQFPNNDATRVDLRQGQVQLRSCHCLWHSDRMSTQARPRSRICTRNRAQRNDGRNVSPACTTRRCRVSALHAPAAR